MLLFSNKPAAREVARRLADIRRMPNCEDCEVLRGANLCALKHFSDRHAPMFKKNLASIITTHVNLECRECPVDDVMKMLKKDRLAAVAAMF